MTNEEFLSVQSSFCPYHYADLERAISVCKAINKPLDFIYETARDTASQFSCLMSDLDIIGCLYEHILREAMHDIWDVTGVDIQCSFGNSVYAYQNYLDSKFDYNDDFVDELKDLINKKGVIVDSLLPETKFFLDELGII